MRKVGTRDVFSAMRVVKAAGVQDEIKRIGLYISTSGKMPSIEEVGVEFMANVFFGLCEKRAEGLFYEFVAELLEVDVESVENGEFLDLMDTLKEYVNSVDKERWMAFFDALASLMK